jgi:hypothetical protein
MLAEPSTSRDGGIPKVVQDCHELLLWLIPHLDKFPRSRRFTLGERLETELLEVLAAVTVAAYRRDPRAALSRASERLNVARLLWRLAHELQGIPTRRYTHGAERLDGLGRQRSHLSTSTSPHFSSRLRRPILPSLFKRLRVALGRCWHQLLHTQCVLRLAAW